MSNGWLGNFWFSGFLFQSRRIVNSSTTWLLEANTVAPDPQLDSAVGPASFADFYFGNTVIAPPAGALAIAAPITTVTDLGGATAINGNAGQTNVWNYTHVCPAGTDCLVVAATALSGTQTASAVTYNGVSLTHCGSDATNGAIASGLWYLLNPPSGARYNLQVTYTGNVTAAIAAVNLQGVSPNAPINTQATHSATGSAGQSTVTPNAAGGRDLVLAVAQPSGGNPLVASNSGGVDVTAGLTTGGALFDVAELLNELLPLQLAPGVFTWASGASQYAAVAVAFQFYNLIVPGGTADSSTTSIALQGRTPTVTVAINTVITPAAGAIALTGAAPTVASGALVPAAGALTFAGQAPTLATNEFITAGAVAFTGQLPALVAGTVIAPAVGSLAFTGQAPALAYAIAPPVGALSFAGQAPSLVRGTVIAPSTGALSFTGVAVTLAYAIAPPAGTLSLSGQAPTVVLTSGATPSAAALTFAGAAPLVDVSKSPAAAAIVFAGAVPTQDLGIAPGTGSLNFDGDVAPLDDEFAPAPSALAFSGSPPTVAIQVGSLIVPDAGALAFDADGRDYTAHLQLRSGLKPLPPVPSIPTYPFVQYLQALSGEPLKMRQEAPYLLPEEVD